MSPRERQIAIGIFGAIAAQSVGALLWAGGAAERLSQLEKSAGHVAELRVTTARLEEQAFHIRAQLDRIEDKLGDQGGAP
jgi:hypothetical protein